MRLGDRQEKIVELLHQQQRASVDLLAERLSASRETIRRDLTFLAARGLVRKFHGGAALPDTAPEPSEGSFAARMQESIAQKRAIARAAAALFAAGDTMLVDTGTTTVLFAEALAAARIPDLTVITNSLAIAQAMARGRAHARIFLLGGEYHDEAQENLGGLVVAQVGHFHAAHVVLTVGAIAVDGMLDFSLEETEIARAMIAQAGRVTVLADSTKLRRTGLFHVCKLDRVHRLVTDRPPEGEVAHALARADVEIILAEAA